MRILFLYDCLYPSTVGGVEHRNACLARALTAMGHEVTLAGWARGAPPVIPGVKILSLPGAVPLYDKDGTRSVWAAFRFALASLRIDLSAFDIIETANIPYVHLSPLAWRARRQAKTLIVTWYEVFGDHWRRYKGPFLGPLFQEIERRAAQIGDQVCAISPLTISRFQDIAPQRAVPFWAACGVETQTIAPLRRDPDPTAPPLLYAGRLIPEKRVDLLLQAIALVPWDEDRPLLSIIGNGPDLPRLQALARSLGVEKKCLFHGKLPGNQDVWREVARARVAVQPSSREGFGLFPLEALALARPVVFCTGPLNAIGGIVRDGIEGLGTAPTPEALAAGLTSLLNDEARCAQLGVAGLARAVRFDWNALAKEIEAFFTSSLPRSKG